jgi:hypothetical protein
MGTAAGGASGLSIASLRMQVSDAENFRIAARAYCDHVGAAFHETRWRRMATKIATIRASRMLKELIAR